MADDNNDGWSASQGLDMQTAPDPVTQSTYNPFGNGTFQASPPAQAQAPASSTGWNTSTLPTAGNGNSYDSFVASGGTPYNWFMNGGQGTNTGAAPSTATPPPATGASAMGTPSASPTPNTSGILGGTPPAPALPPNIPMINVVGGGNSGAPAGSQNGNANLNYAPPSSTFGSMTQGGGANLNYRPPSATPSQSDAPAVPIGGTLSSTPSDSVVSGLSGLSTPPRPGATGSSTTTGMPQTPTPTGIASLDQVANANYQIQMTNWLRSKQGLPPQTSTLGTTPATPPPAGTGFSTTNPFTANPFLPNPTGTGPNGQFGFNPTYFPTAATAATVAGMSGGTVTPNPNGLLFAPGSTFTQNQPSNYVTLPNGQVMNPGDVASYYQNYSDPSQANMLQRLVTGALTGVGEGNVGYQPKLANNGIPITGAGNAGVDTNAVLNTLSHFNPFTQQTTSTPPAILNALSQGNQQQQAAAPAASAQPPAAAQQPASQQSVDPQQLQQILAFLQAYSGLGSGAGNPTAVNPSGQLGGDISQILSALLSGQDLYTRQRQYPQSQ